LRWLLIPSLVISLSGQGALAQEEESKKLSLEEKEAIHSLILSLEELEATPEKVDEIVELYDLYTQDATAEIGKLEGEIADLETQLAEAEKRRENLSRRLAALPVAKALLEGKLQESTPAAQPETAAPAAPPAPEAAPAQPEAAAPAEPAPAAEDVFTARILPIFQNNCIGCHGPEKQKSGLRLDSPDHILKGGDFGAIVVPGDTVKSFLVQVVQYNGDVKMPPKEKLSDEDIAAITDWVQSGAPMPGAAAPASAEAAAEPVAQPPVEAVAAAEPAADTSLFDTKIWPVLQQNCIGCHGPEKQKSGLRVDSLEALLKGGDFGPVLVPGDVEKSYLVEVLKYKGDVQMPPKEKLPDDVIAAFAEWVGQGAPWGKTQVGAADPPSDEVKVAGLPRPWSFEPLKKNSF
jgi:mono/diheme cytochrome c family protein